MDSLGKIEVALGVFPAKDGAPAWPAKGGDPQAVAQWSGARLPPPRQLAKAAFSAQNGTIRPGNQHFGLILFIQGRIPEPGLSGRVSGPKTAVERPKPAGADQGIPSNSRSTAHGGRLVSNSAHPVVFRPFSTPGQISG